MICIACLLKSTSQLICHSIKFVALLRRALILVIRFNEILFKSTLRSTSNLQSIRASRLVKIRKVQIREVFNSIRSRNRIASNSLSVSDLRNRSFYHTKHRSSLVYLSQRHQAFRHTNCSSFLIALIVHLFFELFSTSSSHVRVVASAAILSNRTMICIDIYEQFISIMHLVMNLRSNKRLDAIS